MPDQLGLRRGVAPAQIGLATFAVFAPGSTDPQQRVERTQFARARGLPRRVAHASNALARVRPTLRMHAALFDCKSLRATGAADADGDIAFDEAPCADMPDPAAQVIRLA